MTPELHVAAMPFPTRQGTQAVVHAMMTARAGAHREAHLVTYGEGESRRETTYEWHRAARLPGGSEFRSGPSPRKLALDALLVPKIVSLRRRLRPRVVVSHHVEATLACLGAAARPLIFFAHTGLGPELPTYARPELESVLARAGGRLDAAICRRADAVAAISPALSADLENLSGRAIQYVPPPWPVPALSTEDERRTMRETLGLDADASAVLYAGNLDAYQGWELIVGAVARLEKVRPRVRLVVATAGDRAPIERIARAAGIADTLCVVELPGDETGRRGLHAAADVAIVPRRAPGGLSIKLLDALARGVPSVVARRASAGLPIDDAALVTADDDAEALANGLAVALSAPSAADDLAARGRAYVRREHSNERFVSALDALIEKVA